MIATFASSTRIDCEQCFPVKPAWQSQRVNLLRDATHFGLMEYPEAIAQRVDRFLDDHLRAAGAF